MRLLWVKSWPHLGTRQQSALFVLPFQLFDLGTQFAAGARTQEFFPERVPGAGEVGITKAQQRVDPKGANPLTPQYS